MKDTQNGTEHRTAPAGPARADLLLPQELAALGGLEFVARRVVEGFIAGLHRSPHRGFSVEFAEHRGGHAGIYTRARRSRRFPWGPPGDPRRAKPVLTRDVGRDETQPSHLSRIARRHTGSRSGRAPTTCDARHSEGNYQSCIEDLKKRKGADADQPHRIAFKKLVRA